MNTIQKLGAAFAIISIASAASFANAQDTNNTSTPPISRSTAPSDTSTPYSVSSGEAANSPWGSPPVNRAAPPSDPVPKATTRAEEAKRFAAEEREWQRLSTP